MGDASNLERMGRELKCPICLSLLDSAVSLSCNHVFCNACIVKSMKSASNCPVCKIPFQRREVRPAAHMDTLVNIYKSMEVASGVNIFVTQTANSSKLPGQEYHSMADKICGVENNRMCNDIPNRENQTRVKGKCSRKSSKLNISNSNSNPIKPSFPKKKRIQVARYTPSETPTQPENFKVEMRNNADGIIGNSSFLEKEKLALNGPGESMFSPFFWLRDEEDAEKLSQQTDGDPITDTPPAAPCFSDIKDSDIEMTPKKNCLALYNADMFDSEMFDWTQRACSPELCSSPAKMQIEEADGYDGFQEKDHMPASVEKTVSEELEQSVIDRMGAVNVDSLCTLSYLKTQDGDSEEGMKKSKKRNTKANISSTKKHLKRLASELIQGHVDSQKEAQNTFQGKDYKNDGGSLTSRKKVCRWEKVGFSTAAAEKMPENISSSLVGENSMAQGGKSKVTGLLSSPNQKESKKFDRLEKTGKSCEAVSQQKMDVGKRSSLEVPSSVNNSLTETQNMPSQPPMISISKSDGKKVSNLCVKARKEEEKKTPHRKYDGMLRCQKVKFSMKDSSKDKLGNKSQDIADEYGEEKTQPTGKHRCHAIPNKFQCAFCHSTEDSEASGEMAHYLKGKPVSVENGGGSNILHVHRQCTEWAPNVYFEEDNAINLEAEVARSRRIKCSLCGNKGAALGCYEKSCRKSFHVPCAKLTPQCRWDNDNFVMLCPLHASLKLPNEKSPSQVKHKSKSNTRRQSHTQPAQVLVKHDNRTNSRWKSLGLSQKLVLCCSALTDAEKETVSEFERFSGVTVLKNWNSSVTHVIASTDENGACRRTLKFLMGILEGKWILSIEWIKASMKAMQPVDEQCYEIEADIHGIRGGPQLGRLRVLGQQPKIFNGYKFFLAGKFEDSYKGYLQDLVIAAGGAVLHRKPVSRDRESLSSGCFTAPTFIIYSLELPDKCDPSKRNLISERKLCAEALANSTGAWVASSAWILNSIAACKLQALPE